MFEPRPNVLAGAGIVFGVLAQSFAEQKICAAGYESGAEMRGDAFAVRAPALPPIGRNVVRMANGRAEYDFAHLHCAERGGQLGAQTPAKIGTDVPCVAAARKRLLLQAVALAQRRLLGMCARDPSRKHANQQKQFARFCDTRRQRFRPDSNDRQLSSHRRLMLIVFVRCGNRSGRHARRRKPARVGASIASCNSPFTTRGRSV
jgi:hypothetical protein